MAEKEAMRKTGKVVLASGTFDVLHMGHVRYLEEAKRAGGANAKLVVIVARDKTAEKRKGSKPVVPEDHRRALVEALKVVDEAILGFEDFNMEKVIEKIGPDIIAVGHDQNSIVKQVQAVITRKGLSVKTIKIGKFGRDKLNSSLTIKRKIIELYRK